MTHFY